jgi:hypothetical protein
MSFGYVEKNKIEKGLRNVVLVSLADNLSGYHWFTGCATRKVLTADVTGTQ